MQIWTLSHFWRLFSHCTAFCCCYIELDCGVFFPRGNKRKQINIKFWFCIIRDDMKSENLSQLTLRSKNNVDPIFNFRIWMFSSRKSHGLITSIKMYRNIRKKKHLNNERVLDFFNNPRGRKNIFLYFWCCNLMIKVIKSS